MNLNPIDENLRSDHLFLLIGTNPLPNLVAARLLLREGGQLYLINSTDTSEAASRLEALLNKPSGRIEVDQADADNIYSEVDKVVRAIKIGSIGLHYTGGTKVMAVQAHQAVKDATTAAVCSYLDARTYTIKFDQIGTLRPADQNVLLAVHLNLEELFSLHGIRLKEGQSLVRDTQLPKSAALLAQLHADLNSAQTWRTWCNHNLRKEAQTERKRWKSESKLKHIELLWPEEPQLQPVVRQICEEIGVEAASKIRLLDVIDRPFHKIAHFCRWLDGIWLEQYVYGQIEEIVDQCDLDDAAMSLDTVASDVKPDFEVDVGVIRGYQLFGISCTTSLDRHLMKSKLFEAYLRTSQLGGDEARTALVCPIDNPDQLQKEINETTPGKVRVFGAQDLPQLKANLADWFTGMDHN